MREGDNYEQNEASPAWFVNYVPRMIWERRYYVLACLALFAIGGVVAAFALPTTYRSTATLLVQAQDLPTSLVDSPATGAVEQRIARIREQVLSRGDLIALIEQNDLYSDERRSEPLSKIIDKMRKATTVSALAGDIGQQSGSQSNTVALAMSFDYPDAAKAQTVLQSFVTKFLSMDTEDVENQASLSVRFLQDQANKLQSQIADIEGQLTALKARNGATLAASGAPPLIDTGSFSAQITSLQNENRQLIAQSRRPAGGADRAGGSRSQSRGAPVAIQRQAPRRHCREGACHRASQDGAAERGFGQARSPNRSPQTMPPFISSWISATQRLRGQMRQWRDRLVPRPSKSRRCSSRTAPIRCAPNIRRFPRTCSRRRTAPEWRPSSGPSAFRWLSRQTCRTILFRRTGRF